MLHAEDEDIGGKQVALPNVPCGEKGVETNTVEENGKI